MRVISTCGRSSHPARSVTEALESAILDAAPNSCIFRGGISARVAGRLFWELHRRNIFPQVLLKCLSPYYHTEDYLAVLIGNHLHHCLPAFLTPGPKHLYLFDAWPELDPRVATFVRRFGVASLFVSASQSAQCLAAQLPDVTVAWIPEGVDPERYHSKPTSERTIDVLQFGRKWGEYHNSILGPLKKSGKQYLYEEETGQLVFPSWQEFADGLADARISICFPSSTTHPARAGGVATMTTRYLQSMASRCLVVGECPPEMCELFGYEPVIQADMANPARQLLDILAHYEDYHAFIERNYRTVCAGHTWKHRWEMMQTLLDREV